MAVEVALNVDGINGADGVVLQSLQLPQTPIFDPGLSVTLAARG